MDTIDIIFSVLSTSIFLLGVLAFLCKKLILHWFSKDIESYKSKLQGELEGIKSGYAKAIKEHEVIFSRFDKRKANAIHNVHTAFISFENELTRLIKYCNSNYQKEMAKKNFDEENRKRFLQEQNTKVGEEFFHLTDVIKSESIYFNKDEYELIKSLYDKLEDIMRQQCSSTYSHLEGKDLNFVENDEAFREWVSKDWPELQKELIELFHRVLQPNLEGK